MPPRALVWGGVAFGAGLGGLLDVAVFHLLLQWHHFVMHDDPAAQLRSDGWLMLALLAAVGAGAALAWRARGASGASGGRTAWGALLVGVGSFNAADIVVDHALLRLHRLHGDAPTWAPEAAWLLGSLAVAAGGAWLLRAGSGAHAEPRTPTTQS